MFELFEQMMLVTEEFQSKRKAARRLSASFHLLCAAAALSHSC